MSANTEHALPKIYQTPGCLKSSTDAYYLIIMVISMMLWQYTVNWTDWSQKRKETFFVDEDFITDFTAKK